MKKTHEQFLKNLILKNDEYRNGGFEVVSEYDGTDRKMLVKTKFGLCKTTPNILLSGKKPTIMSAVDKTEFFKNMCIDRFGDNNDDLSEVVYVKSTFKIKVRCKTSNEYYYTTPSSYYAGHRSKNAAVLKILEDCKLKQNHVFEKIKELHPEMELLPNQVYENGYSYLLLRDKYGLVKCTAYNLLKSRQSPTIKSAVNPTEYFISRAREIHGDKYDYSLVEYINNLSKIKVISEFGIFEQSPISHLKGHGCPTHALNRIADFQKENTLGWAYTNWEASAKRSKKFTGYKVYFLECWDVESGERFFKVGKTYRDIKDRFCVKKLMPYSFKVLNIIKSDDAREICELEQFHKIENREFLYTPSKKFNGMNECFSKLINYE